MNKIILLFSVFFSLVFLPSCVESDDESPPFSEQKLLGTWELESYSATPGRADVIPISLSGTEERVNYDLVLVENEDFRITFRELGLEKIVSSEGSYSLDNVFTFNEEEVRLSESVGSIYRKWEVENSTIIIRNPYASTITYVVDEVSDTQFRFRKQVSPFVQIGGIEETKTFLFLEFDIKTPLIITDVTYVETFVFSRVTN